VTGGATTDAEQARVRARLALALDLPDLAEALALARRLRPWFGVAKVGLELYVAEGPRAVAAMRDLDFDVFADLKLHDIPTTVARAARAAGRLGVRYLNAHAAGGFDMLTGFSQGFLEGAAAAGTPDPVPIAVTVLTSDPDVTAFGDRLDVAVDAGCRGVVCSALEVPRVKERAPEFFTVVPGTRPAGTSLDDQARSTTPGEAAAVGADLIVLGRPVTRAADPEEAAAAVFAEVSEAALRPG